jgi:hypothetical protein
LEGATILFQRTETGVLQVFKNGSQIGSNTTISTAEYQIWLAGQGGHSSSVSVSYANGSTSSVMTSSTGSIVGVTQTASSTVDRMGIVVLYKNQN